MLPEHLPQRKYRADVGYCAQPAAAGGPNPCVRSSRRMLPPESNPRHRRSSRLGCPCRSTSRSTYRSRRETEICSPRSRPFLLKIVSRDLEGAFDHQPLLVDTLFQQLEALADLRNTFAPSSRIGRGVGGGRWRGDDSDLLSQIAGDLFDGTCRQRMQFLEETEQQQPRAERIDLARYAAGVQVDQRKAIVVEMGVARPIGAAQPMLDIGSALGFAQRAQMVSCSYPLAQLFEPCAAKDRPKLRLTEQKTLQRHGPVEDDVGQHPQLFERLEGQVLGLVDDQQDTFVVTVLRQCEIADPLQQRTLGEPFLGNSEPACDEMQKIVSGELRRHDLCLDERALVDRRQQIVDQDGLAGADFPGDDDEAFGMMEAIDEIGHRLPVNRALEKEPSIRGELERSSRKLVKFGIHRWFRTSC